MKAEAVFAESGLRHWVSLRQSGILYGDILKNMEPIMFHVHQKLFFRFRYHPYQHP